MKINRRRFSITIILGAIGAFLFDAFWLETYMINWTSFDISEKSDDEKIKVVQLTDMHMTKLQPYHRTVIKRTNQENPDIIFITGDAINENKNLPELDEFLSLLNPEIQKIFILGNKEYWGNVNIPEFKLLCEKYNGTLLVNENTTVTIKNRTLTVIGVDDFVGGNADFGKAAENADSNNEVIVLNHCPEYRDTIEEVNKKLNLNLKLILSGHTHGGQISILGKALYKPMGSGRYLQGWYESDTTKMYVSKGIGTSVIPVRIGSRAEASIFYV